MRSCRLGLAALILAIAGVTGARGVDPTKELLTDRVARLIEQLGDDEFAKREAASRALEAIEAPALVALRKAAASNGDPEIQMRARHVLQAIANRASEKELAKWAGSWKSPDGTWMKISGNRWSSGTPTFGPVAGTMCVTEGKDKLVLADFTVEEGPTKGQVAKAIFRLDGDSLHYCGVYAGDYPTEFKTVGIYYSCIFKRVKD